MTRAILSSQTYPNVRFGLVLEAFCRGLGPYLKDLIKQVEALDKLTALTFQLKEKGPSNANAKDLMRQAGSDNSQPSPLENFQAWPLIHFHSFCFSYKKRHFLRFAKVIT